MPQSVSKVGDRWRCVVQILHTARHLNDILRERHPFAFPVPAR